MSEDLNGLLLNMVEEYEGSRIELEKILSLSRNWVNDSEAGKEVDRLVSYVMGPQEDIEVSKQWKTELLLPSPLFFLDVLV